LKAGHPGISIGRITFDVLSEPSLNPGSAPWSNLGDEVCFSSSLLTIFLPNYY
jgi:hypothetical protein